MKVDAVILMGENFAPGGFNGGSTPDPRHPLQRASSAARRILSVEEISDADDDGFKADGRTQRLDLTSGRIRISVFHRAADCGDQLGGV